jgi:hypothetical protein
MTFTALVCRLLSEWITLLLAAVPPRSRRTFIELLYGCLMAQEGWVTRAISIIGRKCHWTTCFKLLERGSFKTQALANQLLRLVMQFSSEAILTFVLDDTLLLRWSDSAPGGCVAIRRTGRASSNMLSIAYLTSDRIAQLRFWRSHHRASAPCGSCASVRCRPG